MPGSISFIDILLFYIFIKGVADIRVRQADNITVSIISEVSFAFTATAASSKGSICSNIVEPFRWEHWYVGRPRHSQAAYISMGLPVPYQSCISSMPMSISQSPTSLIITRYLLLADSVAGNQPLVRIAFAMIFARQGHSAPKSLASRHASFRTDARDEKLFKISARTLHYRQHTPCLRSRRKMPRESERYALLIWMINDFKHDI